jgi:hypothetical protein
MKINKRHYPKSQSNMEDIMKNRAIILLTGLVLALVVPVAHAAIVTIAIEGVVDTVNDQGDLLEGKINIGDQITGIYSYDTSVLDTNPLDDVADYRQTGCDTCISFNINNVVFCSTSGSVNYLLEVVNNRFGRDRYYVGSTGNEPTDGIAIENIAWNLEDHTETALSDISLPLTTPLLSEWDINQLVVSGVQKPDASFSIYGHVTSATLVPEPIAIALIFTGGIIVRFRKRK